jgi:hypothetical protein
MFFNSESIARRLRCGAQLRHAETVAAGADGDRTQTRGGTPVRTMKQQMHMPIVPPRRSWDSKIGVLH